MNIDSLKSFPQWVCFTSEKKPINPQTGYGAKANDASTWASYDQARRLWASDKGQYAGIGYEFRKGQKITGIDLDKCIDEEGNITPWARAIVERLNSYTEYSPSGRGLHIWVQGEIPENIGPDPTGTTRIEMYDQARYFTITGNRLPGTPETIEPRQEELTLLYGEVVQARKEAKENARQASSNGLDTKYGLKALETERKELAGSPNGSRNAQLNRAAFALGQLVSGNELTRATVEQALTDAAQACGLEESEIEKTLASGLESGMKSPRSAPGERAQQPTRDEKKTDKPKVIVGRQLHEMIDDAINALAEAERDTPTIFVQGNKLVKIAKEKKKGRHVLRQMGPAEIRGALARTADYYRLKEKGDQWYEVSITPPKEIVESIVSPEDPGTWPFLPLDAIVNAPVIRPDGTVVDAPGYDKETMIYYAPTSDLRYCRIPCSPSKQDAIEAMAKIENIIAEFPFATQVDRVNALGAILTPFIRQALRETDDVPIGVLDAASPGTGKGLLACIIAILATGVRMSALPAPDTEEEWDKKIVTELLEGNTFIVIDNIPGILKSAKLEAVLTARYYKGRVLGRSQSANPENRATWLATGNNLKLAGDLPERCYWIRMVALTSNPEARVFSIPDLMSYVIEHRCELVTALLTVIRAWYVAGKPLDTNLGGFRTFTTWSNTVGSILHYAGIEGFLSDRIARKDEIDVDRKQWAEFLRAWHAKFGSVPQTVGQIKQAISAGSDAGSAEVSDFFFALPEDMQALYSERPDSFSRRFGKALEKRVDRRFGTEDYYLQRGKPNRTNVSTWMVITDRNAGSAGSDLPPNAREILKNEVPVDDNTGVEGNHIETGADHSLHSLQNSVLTQAKNDAQPPVEPAHEKGVRAGSQRALPADESTPCTLVCDGCTKEQHDPDEEWNFGVDGLCYCPVCWSLHAAAPVLAETRQSEVVETIIAYTAHLVPGMRVALDLETTGLDRYQHKVVSVQLGIQGEEACILDVRPYYSLPEAEQRVWRHALQTLFATPEITWLGHNLKFDWLFLVQHFGVKPGRSIDTMIVEQVLRNGEKEEKGKYALKNVAARYGLAVSKEEQLATTTLKEGEKLNEQLLAYMAQDVTIPHQVYAAQQALVEEAKVGRVIDLEHEALLAVIAMEHHGAMVDRAQLAQIVAIKQQKKAELEAVLLPVLAPAYHQARTRRASEKAGARQDALWSNLPRRERETFKLSSNPQLQLALAELGVIVEDTRAETLEAVMGRHACLPVLVEWRKVQKLVSTLTSQVAGHIRPDGRIHTQFSLAQSGRYTTRTPNIQGLPKQKEGGSDAEDPRRCIVAPPGSLLLQADLSNVELRILAEVSGDATMLRFFAEGKDLHAETARLMFNLAPDANTKKTLVHGVPARMVAKTINFGLAYGMGVQGLAGRVGVSEETAKELMQKYFKTYKDVARYLRSSGRTAMERGYAESASGRRRVYPVSGDYWKSRERVGSTLLGLYERSAKNHPIQGTNADILKRALALLYARLPEDAHLVLTIHDEFVVEVPEAHAGEAKTVLQDCMVEACQDFLKTVANPTPEVAIASYWKKD